MLGRRYALGVDYGTNSVRALIVDIDTGEEVGSSIYPYPSGRDGIILDADAPHFARQNPEDYVQGMEASVRGAVEEAMGTPGFAPERILGIGVDTTGSTPIPVDERGMPLSFLPRFSGNPNAMAWLWKDHTSYREAELVSSRAREYKVDYTRYCGGMYSSEWFFAKILHLANTDPEVFHSAATFVEHCDWMPALLAGNTKPGEIRRSRCASGHKAMWNKEWGGLPSEEFLASLSPHLAGIRDKLYSETYTAGTRVGGLCPEWAERLGLVEGIAVSAGAFDAHMGAVGAGITPGTLVKIMGTSSCDMMVSRELGVQIEGICGQVDGSILPGMIGLEAGQSAVGDIFAWYRDQMRWPIENLLPQSSIRASVEGSVLPALMEEAKGLFFKELTERAAGLSPGESGLMALDWLNGNRTVLVDPNLTGMIVGLTLGTRPEEIFAALVESTAYGARMIIERFEEYGVKVDKIVACGGLAEKNPFLMQTYADVTGRCIQVSRSAQTCALGAAMFGAVAGGCFASVEEAQARMSGLRDTIYTPIPRNMKIYDRLFALYRRLHDSFGTRDDSVSLFSVMKELLEIRRAVLS